MQLTKEQQHVLATADQTALGQVLNDVEANEIEKERRQLDERPVFHFGSDVEASEHSLFRLGRLDGLRWRRKLSERVKQEIHNGLV